VFSTKWENNIAVQKGDPFRTGVGFSAGLLVTTFCAYPEPTPMIARARSRPEYAAEEEQRQAQRQRQGYSQGL
jgi:hypothetical protein